MDTEKFKMGWLLVFIERPDAKLRRFLKSEYHRLNPGTYVRPCVSFLKQDEHIEKLRAKLPTESRLRAIWVTRAQWERSYVCSGPPAQPQEAA